MVAIFKKDLFLAFLSSLIDLYYNRFLPFSLSEDYAESLCFQFRFNVC